MTDDDAPDVGSVAGPGPDPDRLRAAWEGTVEDMTAMAEARRERGWEALAVAGADTAPEHHEVGDTDRYGLTFVVPEEDAGAFRRQFRKGSYPAYEVFRRDLDGRVFLVVEYRDEDEDLSILAAGQFDRRNAARMVGDAAAAGEFFTHFRTVDGDHLGTFRHDGHEKFVPEADALLDSLPEDAVDSGLGDPFADEADGEENADDD